MSAIPESDLYLWNHAQLQRAWEHFGAHPVKGGVRFAVWAPYARAVGVVGEFNDWRPTPLTRRGDTGVWEGVVPKANVGQFYKYELVDSLGAKREKTDPFGFRMEMRPKTASQIWPLHDFAWSDDEWLATRAERQTEDQPLRIYEVHLGSWRKGRTYAQLAVELVTYVVEMGFTHVEFLPLTEFPYDASWGYQVCGYYAPTSRYGTPEDLKTLINALHRAGIGVLLDWVPAHFPRDEHGLARFDGTHLFEHDDPRRGVHKDWDTLIFNYERPEVRNFLWSSALYWCEVFHFDGIRVDAVASMLHRDYSREDGEWVPDTDGSNLDRAAIRFLRELNTLLHEQVPGALSIAEESTAFPDVSRSVANGGLGFDLKWSMGWMHDSLEYLKHDPIHRKHHHNRLTFALYYAFKEKYLLPLSHDEVVHMKGSLLNKMPGDAWQQHANLRLLHAFQAAHPGKSLVFMGGEFGQRAEWNHDASLEWGLLNDKKHAGQRLLVGDLNRLVRDYPALYEWDHDWRGFAWLEFEDSAQSLVSFYRWSREKKDGVLWIFNFTPVVRDPYVVSVARAGAYREILNTDSPAYGGSGVGNLGVVDTVATDNGTNELRIVVPPLAAVALALPPATPA